jgi:hypothetical protein
MRMLLEDRASARRPAGAGGGAGGGPPPTPVSHPARTKPIASVTQVIIPQKNLLVITSLLKQGTDEIARRYFLNDLPKIDINPYINQCKANNNQCNNDCQWI